MKILYKNTLAILGTLRLVEFGKHSNRPYGVIQGLDDNATEIAIFDDLDSAVNWYEDRIGTQLAKKRGAQ